MFQTYYLQFRTRYQDREWTFVKLKQEKRQRQYSQRRPRWRIIDWWLATKYKTMRVEVFQYPMWASCTLLQAAAKVLRHSLPQLQQVMDLPSRKYLLPLQSIPWSTSPPSKLQPHARLSVGMHYTVLSSTCAHRFLESKQQRHRGSVILAS